MVILSFRTFFFCMISMSSMPSFHLYLDIFVFIIVLFVVFFVLVFVVVVFNFYFVVVLSFLMWRRWPFSMVTTVAIVSSLFQWWDFYFQNIESKVLSKYIFVHVLTIFWYTYLSYSFLLLTLFWTCLNPRKLEFMFFWIFELAGSLPTRAPDFYARFAMGKGV